VERVLDVIVHPHLGQEPGVGALVHRRRRLVREGRLSPGRDHVFERTGAALVRDRAILDPEPAAVREEDVEETQEGRRPAVDFR